MQKITPETYQQRLDRLTDILSGIVEHADEVSTRRCPYKNRLNQCTAQFGCRNKRKPLQQGGPPLCAGDDKLDYRKAWEGS
jgi:hypothetical protein